MPTNARSSTTAQAGAVTGHRPVSCSSSSLLDFFFDELSIGASFTTAGRKIVEADLLSFASLTGDWHPQHTDAGYAATTGFGERIAHGMLVLSYAVGLVPFDPQRIVALRRISDATFKKPVRIGDSIRVRIQIEALKPIAEQVGLVRCRWTIVNQNDDAVVRVVVDTLWRRSENLPDEVPA